MPKKRANGEGSIYHSKAGDRWVAIMLLPNGKRKYFYAKTRAEVAKKLREAQRRRDDHLPIVLPTIVVAAYIGTFLDSARSTLKPGTYRRYEELSRKYIIPSLGRIQLARLAPQHIQQLYTDLLDGGLAPASVRHVHAVIHRALNQALRWGLVTRNVASLVDRPRVPHHPMQTLSPAEARNFLATAAKDRLWALYVLALTTGMRQGELLALMWAHVGLDAGTVQVRGSLQRTKGGMVISEPKNGRYRQVMLSAAAVDALRRHRVAQATERLTCAEAWHDTGLVFTNEVGGSLDANNLLRRSFYPLLAQAEVPRIRFHDLRHTAATLLLGENVHPKVVSEMLGHSGIGITLDLYSHVTPTMQGDAARTFDKLLAP